MMQPENSYIQRAREARWEALKESRRLLVVELGPARRVIHVTPCCGLDSDRIMVNTYEHHGSLFLTVSEVRALATELNRAATVTSAGVAAWPIPGG